MSVVNPNVRFTYEDYKSLPESMDKRYELVDGDLVMVPAPTTTHQRVSRNLEFLLLQFVREFKLGQVFDSPIDVVLGEGKDREVVQPDLIFVGREREHIIVEEEVRGAPDLVVEILSPGTEERDKGYKKKRYARYGVKEYWVIDPKGRTVEVHTPDETGFQVASTLTFEDTIHSPLLPDFKPRVSELFRHD